MLVALSQWVRAETFINVVLVRHSVKKTDIVLVRRTTTRSLPIRRWRR
jgi:hypothetical protein